MGRVPVVLLISGFLAAAASLPSGAGEASEVASGSRVQAERAAVDLRQGMTLAEVQQLLGKPWRTALTSNGGYGAAPSHGTLRWTYTWRRSASSSAQPSLNIDFAAKTAEQWYVNGWSWGMD